MLEASEGVADSVRASDLLFVDLARKAFKAMPPGRCVHFTVGLRNAHRLTVRALWWGVQLRAEEGRAATIQDLGEFGGRESLGALAIPVRAVLGSLRPGEERCWGCDGNSVNKEGVAVTKPLFGCVMNLFGKCLFVDSGIILQGGQKCVLYELSDRVPYRVSSLLFIKHARVIQIW
jgi:hypothetical protein